MKRIVVLLMVFMTLAFNIMAQPAFDENVNDVPINGWVILLFVIGVGYGIRKLYRAQVRH